MNGDGSLELPSNNFDRDNYKREPPLKFLFDFPNSRLQVGVGFRRLFSHQVWLVLTVENIHDATLVF